MAEDAVRSGGAVRAFEQLAAEDLRRGDGAQLGARRRAEHPLIGVDALDRVNQRRAGDRRAQLAGSFESGGEIRRLHHGRAPSWIAIRLDVGQCGEAGGDGVLALRAAVASARTLPPPQDAAMRVTAGAVGGAGHDYDLRDLVAGGERGERVGEDGASASGASSLSPPPMRALRPAASSTQPALTARAPTRVG